MALAQQWQAKQNQGAGQGQQGGGNGGKQPGAGQREAPSQNKRPFDGKAEWGKMGVAEPAAWAEAWETMRTALRSETPKGTYLPGMLCKNCFDKAALALGVATPIPPSALSSIDLQTMAHYPRGCNL